MHRFVLNVNFLHVQVMFSRLKTAVVLLILHLISMTVTAWLLSILSFRQVTQDATGESVGGIGLSFCSKKTKNNQRGDHQTLLMVRTKSELLKM